MRRQVLFAVLLSMSLVQAWAQDSDPVYLEKRNDLGLVAYCSEHDMLPKDSERFFKLGIDEVHGRHADTPEGDLHERKGREGIAYLQGEEQSIGDMAAAYQVDVAEVCAQYKLPISLGKLIAARPAK